LVSDKNIFAIMMKGKNIINYQASACATFITFFLFALHAGILGYGFQTVKEFGEDYGHESDKIKDLMYMFYAVSVGVAGSSVFYGLFLCMELHTAIYLRVILLISSMVIYFGGIADAQSLDRDVEDFDTSDWAEMTLALAWVFLAGFELNQSFYKQCGRITSKILVLFFYALTTAGGALKGFHLMDEDKSESQTYDPALQGKILLVGAGFAGLATLAFLFYVFLDHSEPLKLHMIFAILMALTMLASSSCAYHQERKDWNENMESCRLRETRGYSCDFWEMEGEMLNLKLASHVCQALALLSTVGFDAYFLETQKVSQEDLRGMASV